VIEDDPEVMIHQMSLSENARFAAFLDPAAHLMERVNAMSAMTIA
jgi:hypothetical protein